MGNKEPTLSQSHSGTGHNIAGDMNVYNFGKHDFSTDLAIAILVGSWDESKNDDISLKRMPSGLLISDKSNLLLIVHYNITPENG